MRKPKRELNPKLSIGDRIMCVHMDGETSVTPGTKGTVTRVVKDPFENDAEIISVDWDNGSRLGLLTVTDSWFKDEPIQVSESLDPIYDYWKKNPEIFKNFDYRFLNDYLKKVRESSVENMLAVQPFLYSGREWIDRYFGEDQEDNQPFQEVLEMADESKNKMIQGVLKYMQSKNMEIDLGKVNHLIHKFAVKILELYITFF
jgi:hypothetical protein